MKKLFFLIIPFFIFAYEYPDFRPCLIKYSFIQNSIPVTKSKSVTFDKNSCIKYDPFTGICVIKHKNKKTVKFFDSPQLGWWASSVKKDEIYVGNFAKDELFFTPAQLSVKSLKNSVITDMFCRAIGIGRGDGFIKADMVKHFVKYGYWGDIGIDVDKNMKIKSFDPLYVKGLSVGDKITKINSKPANAKLFAKYVLLGKENGIVSVTLNTKKLKIKIRKKTYLFTPLNHYGIKVDKNLQITYISKDLKDRYFINRGAKIIEVNSQKVKTFAELKKALSTYKNVTITVMDQGIRIKIPLR